MRPEFLLLGVIVAFS